LCNGPAKRQLKQVERFAARLPVFRQHCCRRGGTATRIDPTTGAVFDLMENHTDFAIAILRRPAGELLDLYKIRRRSADVSPAGAGFATGAASAAADFGRHSPC
jgi:hypothetical protein